MSENELTPEEAARAAARLAAVRNAERAPQIHEHTHEEYFFDRSQDAYWCRLTRSLVSAMGVNGSIPMERWRRGPDTPQGAPGRLIKPSDEIKEIANGQFVQSSTWAPGEPEVMEGWYAGNGVLQQIPGMRCYNTFRPGPVANTALADQATPWVEHVKRLWPEESEHGFFFDYCAHMIQKPHEKCNAAIVVSGRQGIGKDAALLPLREAVGHWNTRNIGPDALLQRFNPWAESLMLTVDEVRPTDTDHKATAMYDALKTLITTPPDVLPLENKSVSVRYVLNRLRIFLTTNDHLAMYIPPEDRRLMVLHSRLPQNWHIAAGDPEYFQRLFRWMENGGAAAVAGWLAARDLSAFDPKGPVPKTETWAEIAQRWDAPEDELTQALDMLGEPDCVLGSELAEQLFDGQEALARMMKSRGFVHRMAQAGYRVVPLPPGQKYWVRIDNGYRVKTSKIYIRDSLQLTPEEAVNMARARLDARAKAGPSGAVPRSEGRLRIIGENS